MFSTSHSSNLLADLAPHILQPAILSSPHFSSRPPAVTAVGSTSSSIRSRLGLGWGAASKLQDSNSLYIREKVEDLLRMEVPPAPFDFRAAMNAGTNGSQAQNRIEWPAPDAQVPLIRGFLATTPAARNARLERRRKRAGLGEQALGLEQGGRLGLRERGEKARGLLGALTEDVEEEDSLGELGINRRASTVPKRRKRAGRKSELLAAGGGSLGRRPRGAPEPVEEDVPELSLDELQGDAKAVEDDMANVAVRRVSSRVSLAPIPSDRSMCAQSLLNSQIGEVDQKMAALDAIREGLRRNLLSLREEELELEDERGSRGARNGQHWLTSV